MYWESLETEASGASLVESWYIRLMFLPTEASLLRPIEFGCPPGIHAR